MGQSSPESKRPSNRLVENVPNNFVCAACLDNAALGKFVEANATMNECYYCEETKPSALLPLVVERMAKRLYKFFDDAENEISSSKELRGKYRCETFDGSDLLDEVGFNPTCEMLRSDIAEALDFQVWCRVNPNELSPAERKESGWREFKKVVQHERRYTFWSLTSPSDEPLQEEVPVGEMLKEVGEVINRLNIVTDLPIGGRIWRVRVHSEEDKPKIATETELCPPPLALANRANRMSPPGIVMFYGAQDFETACIETIGRAKQAEFVTGAEFITLKRLRILDLAKLPPFPDFFEANSARFREDLSFLRGFAKDIAKPIKDDRQQHVQYVPTQAFTEYVRYELKTPEGNPIHGICYQSSQNGRPCFVIFCDRRRCIEELPRIKVRWLQLDLQTVHTFSMKEILQKGVEGVGKLLRPKP